MDNCTRFSARASLVVVALLMARLRIWEVVEGLVKIKQKTIKHRPLDKLLAVLINILAGGHGLVEINTRVRPDHALLRAFGQKRCADQSLVSTTLNRCADDNVGQMRRANQMIYQAHSQSYRHEYDKQWQLLDVDMSGMLAGRQGEGVSKGYFSGQRGGRGRKLGRVTASLYDEIVLDRLYSGKTLLGKSFQELVREAEKVMGLTPVHLKRTILRIDGGGGSDKDVNWALERGYGLLVKVKNWQRANKLSKSVKQWHQDPKVPSREFGWVEEPHAYVRPTRQLAVRKQDKKGNWRVRVLVTNLDAATLFWVARKPIKKNPTEMDLLGAVPHAYDLRGGGAEASIKDSKQGLGITKRNKRSFNAQEMLVLLAQLASNLITWTRNRMAQHVPDWRRFGSLRMVRDVFHIAGKIELDAQGRILKITLNQDHVYSAKFLAGIGAWLASNDLVLNLCEI